MNPSERLTMSAPSTYLIRVSGWLDESWTDYFSDFSVTVSAPADAQPETTLCGTVSDQTALMGVLGHLYDLGTTLLSVQRLSTS